MRSVGVSGPALAAAHGKQPKVIAMKRSTIRFAFALAFSTANLFGCSASQRPPPQTASTTTTTSAALDATPGARGDTRADSVPSPPPTVAVLPPASNDDQILGALKTADRSVLEQARQAVRKAGSAEVRELAQELLESYVQVGSSLKAVEARAGLTVAEGPMSEGVRRSAEQLARRLDGSAGGASFDRIYVAAQLEEAARLLELLDRVDAQAQSAELQATLRDLRERVVEGQSATTAVQAEIAR
jgi:predicted outer membrane protein